MDNSTKPVYCPRTLLLWHATRAYANDPCKINLSGDTYTQCWSVSGALEHWTVSWVPDTVKESVVGPTLEKTVQVVEGLQRRVNSQTGGNLKELTRSFTLSVQALDERGRAFWELVCRGADQHLEQLQSLYPDKSNQNTAIKGPRNALQAAFDTKETFEQKCHALSAEKIQFGEEEWSKRKVRILSLVCTEMAQRRGESGLLLTLAKVVELLVKPNWASGHKKCDYNPIALSWVIAAQDLCPEPTSKRLSEAKTQMTRLGFVDLGGCKALYLRYPSGTGDLYAPSSSQGEHRQFEVCESLKVAAEYLNAKNCQSLWPLTHHIQGSITKLIGHYQGQSAQGALETAFGYVENLKTLADIQDEQDEARARRTLKQREDEQARQRKAMKKSGGGGKAKKGSNQDLQGLELADDLVPVEQKREQERLHIAEIKRELLAARQLERQQKLEACPRPKWQGLEAKLEQPLFEAFDALYTERLEQICIDLHQLMVCPAEETVNRDAAHAALTQLTDFMLATTSQIVSGTRLNPNYLN